MPLKQTQHLQPDSMHLLMQSQQACNIWQQALSPLMQVMQQPSLVISHSQLHMTMLHWQTTMPFIMQQQLHMPSHIMRHMFCNMAQAISSSHLQWILMPLGHFSIFIVQQGTMQVPHAGGHWHVGSGHRRAHASHRAHHSAFHHHHAGHRIRPPCGGAGCDFSEFANEKNHSVPWPQLPKAAQKKVLRASGPSGGQRKSGKASRVYGWAPSKHSQCSDCAKCCKVFFLRKALPCARVNSRFRRATSGC